MLEYPRDNIRRKKITIFNNRILTERITEPEIYKNTRFSLLSKQSSTDSLRDSSKKSERAVEVTLFLKNGEKKNIYFTLNKNLYKEVEDFCENNNLNEELKDLILDQINGKLGELERHSDNNENNENKNNSNIINDICSDNLENINENEVNAINNEALCNKYFINDLKIIERRKEKLNSLMKKNKKLTKEDNIGEILYDKGIKFKIKKQLDIQRMKREIELNSPKYSFHPSLNKKTIEIANRIKNKNINIKSRLNTFRNKKLNNNRFSEENEKNNSLNSINNNRNNKKEINLKRNKSHDLLSSIFNEKNKENKYFNQDLRTKYNNYKKNKSEKKYNINNIINDDNNEQQEENEEKIIQNNENNNNYNNKDNQQKIKFRNKKNKLNLEDESINDMNKKKDETIDYSLYSVNTQENSPKNIKEENKKIKEQTKKNFEKHANNIMERIKEYKFKEIFNSLDLNKKGYLCYSNLNFVGIDQKILDSISPLIYEINTNKNKKVYFNEFKNFVEEPLSKYMRESE